MDDHPGGADSILEQAGRDGTKRFEAVHTKSMLEDEVALGILVD